MATRVSRVRVRRTAMLGAVALTVVTRLAAGAASVTWTGKGTTPNWDEMAGPYDYVNWVETAGPVVEDLPGMHQDVVFGSGFASGNPNLNGSRSVHTLTFDSSVNFSIVGGQTDTLTLIGGSIARTAASSGTQTITVPVLLNTDGTWDLGGTGGVVLAVNSGNTFYLQAQGSLTKLGSADLTFSGSSGAVDGALTISAGNLILDHTQIDAVGNLILNSGGNVIGNHAQINVSGLADTTSISTFAITNNSNLTTSRFSQISGSASVAVQGVGSSWTTQDEAGGVLIGSSSMGSLSVLDGANLQLSQVTVGTNDGGVGSFSVRNGGTASIEGIHIAPTGNSSGSVAVDGNNSSLSAQIDFHGDATLNVSNGGAASGDLTLNSPGARINISSGGSAVGNLSINSSGAQVTIDGGRLTVETFQGVAGANIVLVSDPAGGHAMVIDGGRDPSAFSGNISGNGSMFITGVLRHGNGPDHRPERLQYLYRPDDHQRR